jgi:UDP-N-acetylglucosamine:LPS N-acetylglucosamine transferase
MSTYLNYYKSSHVVNRIMSKLTIDSRTESDPTPLNNATSSASGGGSGSDEEGRRKQSSLSSLPEDSRQDSPSNASAAGDINNNDSKSAPTENNNNNDASNTQSSSSNNTSSTALRISDPVNHPRALKILFLSSDTGGGHRASATSLAQQFQNLFPGSTYALCDIVQLDGPPPYNTLVKTYKHLSAHPHQWKLVYNVSNTRAYEMLADVHMKSAMERSVRRRIQSYDPDVVVSVHPLMTNVPVLACRNITKETGKHLPIFTVCTDLGSAHSMWFSNGVEKLFVASEVIRDLAMQRGKVPLEKIVMSGLPIRHDFAVQAEKMGTRLSPEGKVYQKFVREQQLGLQQYSTRKTVLVMGGGEGCGRLSNIVDALYLQFVERGMEALILVVCGRNDALKESLANRDWESLRDKYLLARTSGADFDSCVGLLSDVGCIDGGYMASHLRRIISTPTMGLGGGGSGAGPLSSLSSFNGSSSRKKSNSKDSNARDGLATSLPASRSGSPIFGDEEDDCVEVVTKSYAQRNPFQYFTSAVDSEEDEDGRGVSTIQTPMAKFDSSEDTCSASVTVIGLGFITNMAEYMVAADVLVSKAGPGTIAEAASLSLPVMLTSFLPGQEEGNVDYVVEGQFGTFVSDSDAQGISDVVASWLLDEKKLKALSDNAHKCGAPDAAAEIVESIGESALRWKHHIEESEDGGVKVKEEVS